MIRSDSSEENKTEKHTFRIKVQGHHFAISSSENSIFLVTMQRTSIFTKFLEESCRLLRDGFTLVVYIASNHC